jgi:hypothetical protein
MWMGTGAELGALQPLTEAFSDAGSVQNAEPVNVRLRGVNVPVERDLGGGLDLVIVTKFQFANQPKVTRLHYLQQGASPGWYDALYQNMVFTTRDFNHDDVTLRVQVYDRDKLEEGTVKTVTGLAATVGVAVGFPGLASLAKAAGSVSETLTDIADSLDSHDEILDDRVRLEPDEEANQGTDLLQPGFLVAFGDARIRDEGYRLNQNTELETPEGAVAERTPYAVFEVEREHNEVEFAEKDQKAAKLAAELNGKGQSNKDPLYYLRETVEAYDKFDRVRRAEQLQRLNEQEDVTLTDAEKSLLGRLRADLETGTYLN